MHCNGGRGLGWRWGNVLGEGRIVEARAVGAGGGEAICALGKDEFNGSAGGGVLPEKHVRAGAIDQGSEHGGGRGRAVVAEDARVGDTASDGHAGRTGDVMEDLQEAGVVGADFEQAIGEDDASTVGGALVKNSGSWRGRGRGDRCGLGGRQRGLRRLILARSGSAAEQVVVSVLGAKRGGREEKRDGSKNEGGMEAAHLQGGTCAACGR